MASINEGFVEDDDTKEKLEDERPKSPKELVIGDIFDVEIDYSKVHKRPLFFAAISGNHSIIPCNCNPHFKIIYIFLFSLMGSLHSWNLHWMVFAFSTTASARSKC